MKDFKIILVLCSFALFSCGNNEDKPVMDTVDYINTAKYLTSVNDNIHSNYKEIEINGKSFYIKETKVFEKSLSLLPIYRIPSVIVTDKGTILLSCENRESTHDEGLMNILIARKEIKSDSWIIQEVFSYSKEKGRPMNPVFVMENAEDDRQRIYSMVGQFRDDRDCLYSTSEDIDFVYKYSDDDGNTWSDFISIKEYWDTTKYDGAFPSPTNGIVDANGMLVVPLYIQKEGKQFSGIAYRNNNRWVFSTITNEGDNESTVYTDVSGNIILDCRTRYNKRRKYVYNLEKDEYTLLPWSFNNSINLKAEIIRVDYKGEIFFLMPFVDTESGLRENLTLYGSKDGNTWKKIFRIMDGKADGAYGREYAYSNISWGNQIVVLTYETNQGVFVQDISMLRDEILYSVFHE